MGEEMEFDELSRRVIGCAIEVHRVLGPGLLESAYEQCLAQELSLQGIAFRLQCPQPVDYKGMRLDCGYRIDVQGERSFIAVRGDLPELEPGAPLPACFP